MAKLSRFILTLVLAGLILQFTLPWIMERELKRGIAKMLPQAEQVEVEVRSWPAIEMLAGRFDSLIVTMERLAWQGLPVDRIEMEFQNVAIDIIQLVKNRQLTWAWGQSGVTKIRLAEEDLNKYLVKLNLPILNPSLSLINGLATVTGEIVFLGVPVEVVFPGRFVVTDQGYVQFAPDSIIIEGRRPGENFEGRLVERMRITLNSPQLPWQYTVTGVTVTDGALWIEIRH